AGRVEHRVVVRLVRRAFGDVLAGDTAPLPPRAGSAVPRRPARRVANLHRPTEQAQLVLGSTGLSRSDERRFALAVLNNALGGGMSSRLFQEIRENRGLAYSVYSFTSQYAGAGAFGVYAGVQPNKVRDAIGITTEVLTDVAEH